MAAAGFARQAASFACSITDQILTYKCLYSSFLSSEISIFRSIDEATNKETANAATSSIYIDSLGHRDMTPVIVKQIIGSDSKMTCVCSRKSTVRMREGEVMTQVDMDKRPRLVTSVPKHASALNSTWFAS